MNGLAAMGVELPDMEPDETDFHVFPENWETLELFLSLATQWRVGGMGGYIGLDYTAVDAMFRMLRVPNRAERFRDLQIMERAALEVLNTREK